MAKEQTPSYNYLHRYVKLDHSQCTIGFPALRRNSKTICACIVAHVAVNICIIVQTKVNIMMALTLYIPSWRTE